ncbi:hypothetical protein [Pseudobutyrivibrio sp.]|jgi:hypothetical protein|uniref:hypothetical protein n=1 Tax=Pseudobutyrivibrio sp. TaxID=2014367 RepID=UPI0025E27CB2|nr:hypothetical protein [Pseudobutyrivibrio sp.]
MNAELKATTKRVINVNCELQALAIKMLQDIRDTLNVACKDSTHYSDYLNDYDKDALSQLQSALYNMLQVTNFTIYDLLN